MTFKKNYVPEKGDIKICVDSRGKKEIYIPYRNRFLPRAYVMPPLLKEVKVVGCK